MVNSCLARFKISCVQTLFFNYLYIIVFNYPEVYLSLKGVVYPNNSVILITEIEETNATSNNGLQCITDRRPCCAAHSNRHGEWFFPNGSMVPGTFQGGVTTFFRNRGDNGTVNLNRLNSSIMMPTGRFCCVVPDATDVDQRACAVISKSITLVVKSNKSIANTTLIFQLLLL